MLQAAAFSTATTSSPTIIVAAINLCVETKTLCQTRINGVAV